MTPAQRGELRTAVRQYILASFACRVAKSDKGGENVQIAEETLDFCGDQLMEAMRAAKVQVVACGSKAYRLGQYNSFDVLHVEDAVTFTWEETRV